MTACTRWRSWTPRSPPPGWRRLRLGDGIEPIVQYDADLDLWNVGVLEHGGRHGGRKDYWERFTGGLVDSATGEVVTIIERPWVEERDERPSPPSLSKHRGIWPGPDVRRLPGDSDTDATTTVSAPRGRPIATTGEAGRRC